jgi:hypothetical protein
VDEKEEMTNVTDGFMSDHTVSEASLLGNKELGKNGRYKVRMKQSK